mmetsp:Transcript_24342/g.63508  ORF Transcript_24342/g.63508 Transcript_24342/m.63508 type:complete len:335 (+) Transcript_24342:236-1240(+)
MMAAKGVTTATAAVGGRLPVPAEEFGARAALAATRPRHNPLKSLLDTATPPLPVTAVPPMLGIFLDTPWHGLDGATVKALAKAGFLWAVADGEHMGVHGRYGVSQHEMLLRHGITPIQRLPREALSDHGDSLTLGARATMMPYATSVEQVRDYLATVRYPHSHPEGTPPSPLDRGGYPLRDGTGTLLPTGGLVAGEGEQTQGCVQFETAELLLDTAARDEVLDLMAAEGPNRAFGFVGAMDAVLRVGDAAVVNAAVNDLAAASVARGVHMGRLCGGPPLEDGVPDPAKTEDAMVQAIDAGFRLIGLSVLSSDLPYMGARQLAAPFWAAVQRCGV